MSKTHIVTATPGEDVFAIARRWAETRPNGSSDMIGIRFVSPNQAKCRRLAEAA